jgi:hypothetical protein
MLSPEDLVLRWVLRGSVILLVLIFVWFRGANADWAAIMILLCATNLNIMETRKCINRALHEMTKMNNRDDGGDGGNGDGNS